MQLCRLSSSNSQPMFFLIAFLVRPISISSSRISAARFTNFGTGPSTVFTNVLCALRRAGGTRMPNHRIGSSGLAFWLPSLLSLLSALSFFSFPASGASFSAEED